MILSILFVPFPLFCPLVPFSIRGDRSHVAHVDKRRSVSVWTHFRPKFELVLCLPGHVVDACGVLPGWPSQWHIGQHSPPPSHFAISLSSAPTPLPRTSASNSPADAAISRIRSTAIVVWGGHPSPATASSWDPRSHNVFINLLDLFVRYDG